MVGKSLYSKHTRHKARSGGLALILLAAFAQGSARAGDDDDKNSTFGISTSGFSMLSPRDLAS